MIRLGLFPNLGTFGTTVKKHKQNHRENMKVWFCKEINSGSNYCLNDPKFSLLHFGLPPTFLLDNVLFLVKCLCCRQGNILHQIFHKEGHLVNTKHQKMMQRVHNYYPQLLLWIVKSLWFRSLSNLVHVFVFLILVKKVFWFLSIVVHLHKHSS